MSQQLRPPFGTLNLSDEVVIEKVSYDSGNIATNISDEVSYT
jgi:hypothetical protein